MRAAKGQSKRRTEGGAGSAGGKDDAAIHSLAGLGASIPLPPPPSRSSLETVIPMVSFYARCELPTQFGTFDLEVYRLGDGEDARDEMLLIAQGDLAVASAPFVRLHSECFTGETLLSLKCDCRAQLETALSRIAQEGEGAIVYLRQEGRGIGLGNKIRAYAEQAKGRDTVEANLHLGFPADLRDYSAATEILLRKGVKRIRLNTNNPEKIAAVKQAGIEIVEIIPAVSRVTVHNRNYLRTKAEKMGHKELSKAVSGSGNS